MAVERYGWRHLLVVRHSFSVERISPDSQSSRDSALPIGLHALVGYTGPNPGDAHTWWATRYRSIRRGSTDQIPSQTMLEMSRWARGSVYLSNFQLARVFW